MINETGRVEFEYVDYKALSEVEFAYKYFDWEFYLGRRNISIETMTKDEILEVLSQEPFGFSSKTLKELENDRKREFVKNNY